MPKPFSGSTVEIDIGTERERVPAPPEPDTPFRILIAGDFSGRKNRGIFEPALSRRAIEVDRDNFDLVLEELRPELRLPLARSERRAAVSFRELEDFEPDRIFDRVELFEALRQTRARLGDGATFAAAAAALQPSDPAPEPPQVDLGDLFARTLEETEARGTGRPGRALDDLSALVREIVAPYLEPRSDPRQAELIAQVDTATGAQMREFLHHPDFQALEAAWRSLFFLVRRLETGPSLKLYILDITKEELAAELNQAGDLRATELYRILARDPAWAVWAGNFVFDDTIDDLVLLGYLGGIARAAGAPFLAGASTWLAGCESCAGAIWQELRALPEARWLGLALPGFLLRLPYGTDTRPIEAFDFEEMPDGYEHDAYLWGNPAFACLCLLGQAFARSGWSLRPGEVRDIDGFQAETPLTETQAERLLERGLMPLLSFKGGDEIRLMRFQSLADPPAPLAGRWRSR